MSFATTRGSVKVAIDRVKVIELLTTWTSRVGAYVRTR